MKTWKIPVVWQEMGFVNIESNTLGEAIKIVNNMDVYIPIPDSTYIVNGSWEVECLDEEYIRHIYNDNQEDVKLVEMKPVIHAHWEPGKAYPSEYFCSYCGELWNDIKTKRCHECGAIMDEVITE